MKRAIILTLALTFVVAFAGSVFAYDLNKPMDKLTSGVVDVIQSPILIYQHPMDTMKNDDTKVVGFLKGVIETPFKIGEKAGGGLINIATFPVN